MTESSSPSILVGVDAAMIRAGEEARRIAIQTGTPLAVWQDGRVVLISPIDMRPIGDSKKPTSTADQNQRDT